MTTLLLNTRFDGLFEHTLTKPVVDPRPQKEQRSEPRLASNDLTNLVWIDREGSRRWEQVDLVDRSDDGVGFECSRCFEVGQMVWIDLDDQLHRAVVRFSNNEGDVYRVGLRLIRRDHRRFDREPMLGTATLWVAGEFAPVIIRNVSSDGLQIETAREVPVSEVVRLSGGTLECLAISRYCRASEDRYLTGLEILRQAVPTQAASEE